MQRVESVAAAADACSSSLATEIAERVLEVGSGIPVVGKALELMQGLYKLAKGAKSNQAACERFCRYVQRVERILKRARTDADIAESISDVKEIITEASTFMATLDGKGFFARMVGSKNPRHVCAQLATPPCAACKRLSCKKTE